MYNTIRFQNVISINNLQKSFIHSSPGTSLEEGQRDVFRDFEAISKGSKAHKTFVRRRQGMSTVHRKPEVRMRMPCTLRKRGRRFSVATVIKERVLPLHESTSCARSLERNGSRVWHIFRSSLTGTHKSSETPSLGLICRITSCQGQRTVGVFWDSNDKYDNPCTRQVRQVQLTSRLPTRGEDQHEVKQDQANDNARGAQPEGRHCDGRRYNFLASSRTPLENGRLLCDCK